MTKKEFKIVSLLSVCILIFAIIFASCCTPNSSESRETRENLPHPTKISESSTTYNSIAFIDHNVSGIHYRIFTTGNGAVSVVNVTKDSLEIKNLER